MDKSILKQRFTDLKQQAETLAATKKSHPGGSYTIDSEQVDKDQLLGWKIKVRNLLGAACGKDSEHYQGFCETEKPQPYRDSWTEFQKLRAVLDAAEEDFVGGYITSLRAVVQAEVYDSELEQATALLNAGYKAPAAVIAGVVLESAIRGLCSTRSIAFGKLDRMNVDLCKAGLYTLFVQKKITALADIRNNAAHGYPDEFSDADVKDMIKQIERFLADYPA